MAGQEIQQNSNTSSAAAVGAGIYDAGDAGDAATSKYLQSTGMQHLASTSTFALDQKLLSNQLVQGSLWKKCIVSEEKHIQQKIESPSPSQEDTMLSYVSAMEAALLPCLPARELQAIERSAHSSHQIDVERHARDFMEAAKKIQLYLISLQCRQRPSRKEQLQQEINGMEEELKTKTEMIKKHQLLIDEWSKIVEERLAIHNVELEKV